MRSLSMFIDQIQCPNTVDLGDEEPAWLDGILSLCAQLIPADVLLGQDNAAPCRRGAGSGRKGR